MKRVLLSFVMAFSFGSIIAQKNVVWKTVSEDQIPLSDKIRTTTYSENQKLFFVNINKIRLSLENATDKFSGKPGVLVDFPVVDGGSEKFMVWENSNFAPELQTRYPSIRAYIGNSLKDKTTTINFSLSPSGIQTMILRADNGSEFIEPFTKDNSVYVLFDSKTRTAGKLPFSCKTIDKTLSQGISNRIMQQSAYMANNKSYKTLRLALSCTGEYGAYFGSVSKALAAMNATMTRVNGVYEKDMALHLNIIANNDQVIYVDGDTDPYSEVPPAPNNFAPDAWNQELQDNLSNVLGDDLYDIGHLFGASGGGGNAGCIGCVCGTSTESWTDIGLGKGSGYTSPSDNIPRGDFFDIDYVAHEMGHQLGSNHTFSDSSESSGVQVEPGSGSTIMGYAGITDYNVQSHSDAYFTYRSILQMQTNLATKTCPVSTPIANLTPTVSAGADFSVPSGTAYILKGIATDGNGDTLTYCWEQNNDGDLQTGSKSMAFLTKPSGPTFRSFSAKTSPNRYLPEFSKVLAGTLSSSWESVSSISRVLKFTLTVRDNNVNGSQTNTDEVSVTSKIPYNATTAPTGVGPFKVTSQNTSGVSWAQGTSKTVTWDVNNTTALPGSSNVNIKLSIDGGATFPYVLASDTPNDGSEAITVPATPASSNCRLLIEPTANVYYAVNSKAFAIANLANENFSLSNFSLSPNPNRGNFTVQFDSLSTNAIEILVHDMRGRSIFERKYSNTGLFSQNIQLDTMQTGIYLVTVKDGGQKVIKKIVVE
ncbi:zinc-dependent metalloprotease [Flavobacterium psychrotolerans]|uniref:Propanediol utilization protein n=1 Tax=Flavobacterium psychrotolerans TaxID=2169410 RepID=A0A2U1JJ59_9FLAO|nr:zinc-dependent metalloprotease [Flavobacterium psychrotolerans]PWA05177.1 propanediol utilization protein [Flavobacterium psychrotolerans]